MPQPYATASNNAIPATLEIPLYGAQCDFIASDKHQIALVGGIGSGKSVAGAARALAASLGQVGNTAIRVPNLGVVTAPTHTMLRDSSLRTFLEIADPFIDRKKSALSPPIRIQMKNGSEVLFRSADKPDSLRGPNISWWWSDESALSPQSLYKIMIGRLRQAGRFGYLWLTTTPAGQNWIYQLFVQGLQASTDFIDKQLFRLVTRNNPFLDPAFIQALENEYTGDYALQELDGEFISFKGLVYSEFMFEKHVTTAYPNTYPTVIAGVDWGYNNPGVIQVLGQTNDGRVYLVHEEYARQRGIDAWADIAVQLRDNYRISKFVCDPSEPDNIRKFNEYGVKAIAANNTVSTGIQVVKRRLGVRADGKPGIMFYRGSVHTQKEMGQYQWAVKNSSGDTLDHPLKSDDHTLDALRYGLMELDFTASRKITAERRNISA